MSRGTSNEARSTGMYGDPLVPLGLLVVGLLALCLAVFYPFQQLFRQLSPTALLSGSLVIPAETVALVATLVAVFVVATLYGMVTLLLRL